MRTLEEIKKGLKHCLANGTCYVCPYDDMTKDCDVCRSRLVADVEAYIQQLESQIPRWIPVEERLPEIGVNVLLLHPHLCEWENSLPTVEFIVVTGSLSTAFGYKKKKAWNVHRRVYDIGEECDLSYVTHWMTIPTLPEPPTKEDETNG